MPGNCQISASLVANPPDQLRIGIPKKTPNRYITITKTHVSVLNPPSTNRRSKRILTRLPVTTEGYKHLSQNNLPDINQKPQSNTKISKRPEISRGYSYPEFSTIQRGYPELPQRQKSRVTFHLCPAGTSEKEQTKTRQRPTDVSNELTVSMDDIREKEPALISVDLTSTMNTKTYLRSISNLDTAVKQAINRYISSYDRKIQLQQENLMGKHRRKLIEPKTTSPEIDANNQNCIVTKSTSNKESSKNNQYFKFIKPILPKIITGTPACMFKLFGPILLSAPHGIKLWRGGTDGRKRRIHYRELLVTEILLKIAAEINRLTGMPPSFIIWDRRIAMPADFKNLDPNYLTEKQFPFSPFHEALVQFKKYGADNNLPLLHIDIHGKKNRKTNMDLDVGFKAMETHWHDQSFAKWLKSETEITFSRMFHDPKYEKNNMRYSVNVNPSLCGDWGGDLYTMTCQSVCLGTPAFQLEIPRAIRCQLGEDEELVNLFAKSIVDIYSTCINEGRPLNIKIPRREQSSYAEFLDKILNDHNKIEKTFQEKQI